MKELIMELGMSLISTCSCTACARSAYMGSMITKYSLIKSLNGISESWGDCRRITIWSQQGHMEFGDLMIIRCSPSCSEQVSSAITQNATTQIVFTRKLQWRIGMHTCTSDVLRLLSMWRPEFHLESRHQCSTISVESHPGTKLHKECSKCLMLRSLENIRSLSISSLDLSFHSRNEMFVS